MSGESKQQNNNVTEKSSGPSDSGGGTNSANNFAVQSTAGFQDNLDSIIYLGDEYTEQDSEEWSRDFGLQSLRFSATDQRRVVYERPLGKWKDPFTAPHSRSECVKWASGDWPWGGGWKTCIGHKYQWQWMYVTATLRVEVMSPQDVKSAVEDCLKQGAVVGALVGIGLAITKNPNALTIALATFEETTRNCLRQKLKDIVSVKAITSSGWGDYE